MLMIFGGAQYYAGGGGNDFLCMAEDHEAQMLAYKLFGSTIEYQEDWDIKGDCTTEVTIEWVQVVSQGGVILHKFGRSYGRLEGTPTIKFLEK